MDLLTAAFPSFEKELIDEIFQQAEQKKFARHSYLTRKGEVIRSVHMIVSGIAKICEEDPEGNEFVIAYLKPGHSFGVSLSEESSDSSKTALISIVAEEPVIVYQLSFAAKDQLAKKYDRWYKYILSTAVQYYRFYLELVDSIAFQQMDTRIAVYLKRLSEAKGCNTLQVSHAEIAKGLNTSREVVSRLLKKMENIGKVKLGRGNIEILTAL